MGSANFPLTAMITVGAVMGLVALAALFVLRRGKQAETVGFFTPRTRRLGLIERAALDGGRKLLLVRRDDVEHLIMIGGPIDVVIESGVRGQDLVVGRPKENGHDLRPAPDLRHEGAWTAPDRPYAMPERHPIEPALSMQPKAAPEEEETLELTPMHEAQALQ